MAQARVEVVAARAGSEIGGTMAKTLKITGTVGGAGVLLERQAQAAELVALAIVSRHLEVMAVAVWNGMRHMAREAAEAVDSVMEERAESMEAAAAEVRTEEEMAHVD